MSFSVNDVPWEPESALEHATQALNALNQLQAQQGRELIVASPQNVIWLMLLGEGTLAANQDLAIEAAGNSLSVSLADDNQILNLLPVSGTSLQPATFSTVTLSVAATSAGSCVVPKGSHANYINGITFITSEELTVAPNDTGTVNAVCSVTGPVIASANQITSFQETIANLLTVTNPDASIAGRNQETISQVRNRLEQGNILNWGVDGLIRALLRIPGITQAVAYFNPSTITDLILPGGVTISPRNALMIVIGSDPSGVGIANAYAQSMNAPTEGSESQNYITKAGQTIPINFDYGGTEDIYVKVTYDDSQPTQAGFETLIKDAIMTLIPVLGTTQSTAIVMASLQGFQYATILTAEVSLDGITYSYEAVIDADKVAVYDPSRIVIAHP